MHAHMNDWLIVNADIVNEGRRFPGDVRVREGRIEAVASSLTAGPGERVFDARGRLTQATSAGGVSQYQVNALGQRVKKSAAGIDTVFHYDSAGRLIGESDALGNVKREFIYLNDIPLAVIN